GEHENRYVPSKQNHGGYSSQAAIISEMQAMADENNKITLASMQINIEQQMASTDNNAAHNIAHAAEGQ
ncbi:hypothetical protein L208DRAFT_1409294, partial [Tricholoma matsutake]